MPVIPTNKVLGERKRKDFYRTPDAYAANNVDKISELIDVMTPPANILDPCCGSGVFGRFLRAKYPNAQIIGVDLQTRDEILNDEFPDPNTLENWKCYDHILFGQAFTDNLFPDTLFNLVISNPPFSALEYFIKTGYGYLSNKGGLLSYIARSNFLEGINRARNLWVNYPLLELNFSAKRVPWPNHAKGAKGGSDYETYAQFIWEKGVKLNRFSTGIVLW